MTTEAERFYYDCQFKKCFEITMRWLQLNWNHDPLNTASVLDSDPYHHECLPVHVACMVELKDVNGEATLRAMLMLTSSRSLLPGPQARRQLPR